MLRQRDCGCRAGRGLTQRVSGPVDWGMRGRAKLRRAQREGTPPRVGEAATRALGRIRTEGGLRENGKQKLSVTKCLALTKRTRGPAEA